MKCILFVLLLLAPIAGAQQFNVQSSTPITIICPNGSASAAGNTFKCPGGVTPPQCPSPPGAGPCPPPVGVVYIGQLQFDGVQVPTEGIGPNTVYAYAKVVIPTGQDGKVAGIAVLTDGRSTAWRQVSVSQTIGDFSTTAPAFVQGITATVYLAIGQPRVNAVTVQPNSTWYINIRNQLPFPPPQPSCTMAECDYSLRAYPPS